jgi:hypothetical protein
MTVEWFYPRVNHLTNHCAIDNILCEQKKPLYKLIDFKYLGRKVLLSKGVTDNTPSHRQFHFQDFAYCSNRNTCHAEDPFNLGISFPRTPGWNNG